jgi:hypothetical protein
MNKPVKKATSTKSTPKVVPKKVFGVKLTILGQATKPVKVTPGTTYGQLAQKHSISTYILCVGPDRVENSAQIQPNDNIVAMPKGKAGN